MRTIPQIRARLHELAKQMRPFNPTLADELKTLADETKRRSPIRVARKRLPPLTIEQEENIRSYAKQFPDASYHELSRTLDINSGRISEVLAGKRAAA